MNENKWDFAKVKEKIYKNLLSVEDPKIFQIWVEALQTLEMAKAIAKKKE